MYYPTFTDITTGGPTTNGILWFNGFSYYYNKLGTPQKIFLDNPEYFENISQTLSYSFMSKSWVSFHSYIPFYVFNTTSSFFSSDYFNIYYSNIFKHNAGNYQTFYGTKEPHTVDFIVKNDPLEVKTTQFINYTSKVSFFDSFVNEYIDYPVTYDSATIYNSKQSNGINNIKVKVDNFTEDNSGSDILVTKVDNQ